MYPDGKKETTTDVDNFFTISAEEASVDVETGPMIIDGVISPAITPSYRALYFTVKLKTTLLDENTQSYHSLPIMIYPKTMVAATRTVQTRTVPCLPGTEWPKVLSDKAIDSTYSTLTGMNIDQVQGNIVTCGWSN